MPDAIDEQVNALLRRHLLHVKAERKNDARATMAAPEEHADLVFGRLGETSIPQQQFPIERPAFAPERRAEQAAIRFVAGSHKALKVVTGDQLVLHSRA